MLEQDRSVCDLVNADGACSSPYQSNSKGTHLFSLSRVSTVLHSRLVVTQTSSEMPTGLLQQYLQRFFHPTQPPPPVLFRRLLTHSNKFVVLFCLAKSIILAKYQKIISLQGGVTMTMSVKEGLVGPAPSPPNYYPSIHPSIFFSAYQVETNDKCLMLYQTRISHKREKRKFV